MEKNLTEQRFWRPGASEVESIPTQALRLEMGRQSRGGPGLEPPTSAMFKALLQYKGSHTKSLLAEAAHNTIGARKIKSAAAASVLRNNLIDYFASRYQEEGDDFTDLHRNDVEDWQEPLDMLEDDLSRLDRSHNEASIAIIGLIGGLKFRTTTTPVTSRYLPAALTAQLTKERYPSGIRALDIGCCILAGPLQLVYSDEFPMAFEKVSEAKPGNTREEDLTDKVNRILGRPSIFKEIVGVDVFPYYHEHRQEYDHGGERLALNSLRPSERYGAYLKTINALLDKKKRTSPGYDPDPKVKFHLANLLRQAEYDDFIQQHPLPFDMIIMSYLTQELSPANQLMMHKRALSMLSDGGQIAYVHPFRIHPRSIKQPANMRYIKPYESFATVPWRTNLHLVDNLNPVLGAQEAMGFYDNRCQVARLYAGKLVVNGKPELISDLIRHS